MYFRVWFVTSQLVSSLWIFTWGRKIMSERNGTALKQSIMPKSYFVHLRGIMFCPCVQQTCLNISVHVDTQYSTNRTTNHCPYICPFTDGNSIQQECILYMSSACFVHINANSLSLSLPVFCSLSLKPLHQPPHQSHPPTWTDHSFDSYCQGGWSSFTEVTN